MLPFCVKIIVKESHNYFELDHLKKEEEKEEKHFGHLVTSWFSIFVMLFHTSRHVVGHDHENIEDDWYIVIKVYMFTIFLDFEIFCIIIIYIACPRYPYQLYVTACRIYSGKICQGF